LIFDLNNRTTRFSELGSALPILGLNLGTAFLVWLTAEIWDGGAGAGGFLWSLLAYVAICPCLTQLTLCVHDDE